MPALHLTRELFGHLRGTAYIALRIGLQRFIPYLPQLERLRDRRVRAIVRYAAATVPYYADLFRAGGLDPRDFRTAHDLARLPLLEKHQVSAHPERFRSTSALGRAAVPLKTSGSTGAPLVIYHDRFSFLNNVVFGERRHLALREAFGAGQRPRVVNIWYPGSMVGTIRQLTRHYALIPPRTTGVTLSLLEPVERIVEQINELRPDVINGYGSFLGLLFRTVKAFRIRLHVPAWVYYSGDSLAEDDRALIEGGFGVKVGSVYGAIEALGMGFTCRARQGLHINDDYTHIRLMNSLGATPAPDEPGEVVISNLSNRGTVLLNYRLGDLGVLTTERCDCGRTLPRLLNLDGRAEDILTLSSGRHVHPRIIWRVLRPRDDIIQYQLIQQAPGEFRLKLAMRDRATFEQAADEIARQVALAMEERVAIMPEFVDALEPYGIYKRRPVVALARGRVP